MQVIIDLPEDVARQLQANEQDVERNVLEAIALENYRSGKLTQAQVRKMLGFQTDLQVDAFLKAHNVYLEYSIEDFEKDRETLERALAK
ncbi:MAG: UPF0175 family protein [Pyrinomonadaceae bacterium]|nr:UPF0175 family protein [Pyrinomonadaceae bacterium]